MESIEHALRDEYQIQSQQSELILQRELEARDVLSETEQRLSELSIAIYHQDYNNFFFLSYYCHEVSKLSRSFFSNQSPFYLMGQRVQSEVTRLRSLSHALRQSLGDNENSAKRKQQLQNCIELSDKILSCYLRYQVQINQQKQRFIRIAEHITALDLYTNGNIVARDDMQHTDSMTADQMILQLFDTSDISKDQSQDILSNPSALEKVNPSQHSAIPRIQHTGVMAQRLVNQLFNPSSITSCIGAPSASHSYLHHLIILPQLIYTQYSDMRSTPILTVALFLSLAAIFCIAATHLMSRFMAARCKTALSKNRLCAYTKAGGMLLFSIIAGAYSLAVDEGYLEVNLCNTSMFALMTSILLFSLSSHLATPRIMNGLSLFTPLITLNGLITLFSLLMCNNSIVLVLSPVFYLGAALCMIWFFAFRMSKLRISLRVYGLMSIIFLLFASYASYLGYAYVMMMCSLFWYMLLINIEFLAMLRKFSHLLARRLSQMRSLTAYKSYITLWIRLFTKNLVLPITFLCIMWFSLDWPARTLDLSHFLDSWMKMEYEFNTIIKAISANLILKLITVGIVTNCILRLVQHTLILIYQNKHEGGRNLTILTLLSLIIWLSFIMYCLMMMKANYQSILVILGGMSVGIGLGLKDNIENFISGMSLMMGRLRMGDTIECGGYRGRVTSIGFRTTTMETRCGAIISLQNKELFNHNCLNLTHNHEYERSIIKIGVAYGTDITLARNVIMRALAPLHNAVSQKHPYYVVLNDFGDSSVDLSVYVWVPVQGRSVARSLIREAIYTALGQQGIEIPFPQRDIHIKERLPSIDGEKLD